MKEDVVAANLANLRQSINELKECVNRQNIINSCQLWKKRKNEIKY